MFNEDQPINLAADETLLQNMAQNAGQQDDRDNPNAFLAYTLQQLQQQSQQQMQYITQVTQQAAQQAEDRHQQLINGLPSLITDLFANQPNSNQAQSQNQPSYRGRNPSSTISYAQPNNFFTNNPIETNFNTTIDPYALVNSAPTFRNIPTNNIIQAHVDNNLRQARQSFGFNRQLPYTGARDNNFTANRRLDISAIPGFPQNNLYQQSQQQQPPIPQSTPVPPTTFTPTYIASPSTPPYTAPANINSLPASSETAMLIKALLPSGKSWDLHRSIKDKLQQPASMNLLTVLDYLVAFTHAKLSSTQVGATINPALHLHPEILVQMAGTAGYSVYDIDSDHFFNILIYIYAPRNQPALQKLLQLIPVTPPLPDSASIDEQIVHQASVSRVYFTKMTQVLQRVEPDMLLSFTGRDPSPESHVNSLTIYRIIESSMHKAGYLNFGFIVNTMRKIRISGLHTIYAFADAFLSQLEAIGAAEYLSAAYHSKKKFNTFRSTNAVPSPATPHRTNALISNSPTIFTTDPTIQETFSEEDEYSYPQTDDDNDEGDANLDMQDLSASFIKKPSGPPGLCFIMANSPSNTCTKGSSCPFDHTLDAINQFRKKKAAELSALADKFT